MADIAVKGLRELAQALQTLPAKVEANILRGALRAGAMRIRNIARQTSAFRDRTGALRRSIRVTVRRRGGRIIARVVAGNKRAWYAHIIERGAQAHAITGRLRIGDQIITGTVQHPGVIARPFMRPAADTGAQQALVAMREYMRQRLALKHGIDIPGPGSELDE